MNRRGFLKGLLGVAVSAAFPPLRAEPSLPPLFGGALGTYEGIVLHMAPEQRELNRAYSDLLEGLQWTPEEIAQMKSPIWRMAATFNMIQPARQPAIFGSPAEFLETA